MTFEFLQVSERAGIVHVMINREAARNALSLAVLGEIKACFEAAAERGDLIAASLRGVGERCFAAGGDLHEVGTLRGEGDAERVTTVARAALDALREFPLPVYALLNGDAIGGGAELAMACDVRISSHHARFGYAQASLNLAPAWGGGSDLIHAVGSARAVELMASARLMPADEAKALGIVERVCPPDENFEQFCEDYFSILAERRPQVMRAIKTLAVAHRTGLDRHEMRALEQAGACETWQHDDHWQAHDAVVQRISRRA